MKRARAQCKPVPCATRFTFPFLGCSRKWRASRQLSTRACLHQQPAQLTHPHNFLSTQLTPLANQKGADENVFLSLYFTPFMLGKRVSQKQKGFVGHFRPISASFLIRTSGNIIVTSWLEQVIPYSKMSAYCLRIQSLWKFSCQKVITKCKFSELGDHCPPYLYSTKTLLSFVRLF